MLSISKEHGMDVEISFRQNRLQVKVKNIIGNHMHEAVEPDEVKYFGDRLDEALEDIAVKLAEQLKKR